MRSTSRTAVLALAAVGCLCLSGVAVSVQAQIPQGDVTITLELVAEGLTSPLTATHAGDGTGRLFVVDQPGQIRIVQDGVLLPTPFLDLASEIVVVNPFFDERGLLGLAFHPDYPSNGRFFVRYSAPRAGSPGEPCFGTSRGCHIEVLAEFGVSGDPNVADPTGTILFQVDEPQFNHDAGHVAFGPDGLLYFSLGDGGGAHDGLADIPPSHGPIGHGQDIFTALGAMLRVDVDGGAPYAIPPDNPFAGAPGVDEIYAYGLRNPYRFSFDRGDGRLFLADVGQNVFEEVDIIQNGGNYGWVIREGAHCFDPFNPLVPPAVCPLTGPLGEPLIDPVAEYSHADGIAIVGGFVYRGSRYLDLLGQYVFGDFSRTFVPGDGRLFFLGADGDLSQIFEFQLGEANDPLGLYLFGFGEDEAGELYVMTSQNLGPTGDTGRVFRIRGSVLQCPDDPDPATQGFWFRQCLGVPASDGGIQPGRNGRGPQGPFEPGFVSNTMVCADGRLEDLGLLVTTCEGMEANPPSDPCERAEKQLTALILNVCSERLADSCAVDVVQDGCSSTNVGDLLDEIAALIFMDDCNQAKSCAAAVNEGIGLVDSGGGAIIESDRERQRKPATGRLRDRRR